MAPYLHAVSQTVGLSVCVYLPLIPFPLPIHLIGSTRESLIPRTLEEMGQDLELQQHLAELKRSGQPELTRQERITRQRALDKLNVPSFIKTCKVWFGGGEELTRQEHMSTSRGRGRSTSWTSSTKI